jgi:hypothetical protein
MLVAELHRLRLHHANPGRIIGACQGKAEASKERNESYRAKDRDFGKGVCTRMKYLTHSRLCRPKTVSLMERQARHA